MVQAHDGHFLERTLRCEGQDLDRAMRLYHHAPMVRQILKELVVVPHRRGRLAIPLRDAGPSPHIIVTEDGRFVTCLSQEMSIADLPVLPYRRFVAAMQRADQEIQRYRVRRQQLLDLPWQTLCDALCEGPGHVSREMIQVFDRDPETYLFVVIKIFAKNLKFMSDRWLAIGRANYASRRLEILGKQAFGRAMLCIYLLGFVHVPVVLNVLAPFVTIQTGLEATLAIAMARHPDGGERLLDLLDKGRGDEKALRTMALSMLACCMLQPTKARAVCQRFCSLPLRYDGWEVVRVPLETFLTFSEDGLIESLQVARDHPWPAVVPKSKAWLFSEAELFKDAFWHRTASLFFPPAAQAESVKAAWAENLRQTEEWQGYQAENAVPIRKEARIGRNDPCPCQSGKKYKQCCLGKPTGPTAEEKAAAKMAAREEFVKRTLQSIWGMKGTGGRTGSQDHAGPVPV